MRSYTLMNTAHVHTTARICTTISRPFCTPRPLTLGLTITSSPLPSFVHAQGAVGRLKKMAGAIDTILLSPLLAASSDDAVLTDEAPTELAPADLPSSGSPEAEAADEAADDDEAYDDAQEVAAPSDEPAVEAN